MFIAWKGKIPIDKATVYLEKKYKCNCCHKAITVCDKCGEKLKDHEDIFCVLHPTVDEFYYDHFCARCAPRSTQTIK